MDGNSTLPGWENDVYPWKLKHNMPMTVTLILSYTSIFVCGLLGNMVVVLTVIRNRNMRFVTNLFICNLSVADLLVTIFVEPLTLMQNIFVEWQWGSAACWSLPFCQGVCVSASALTLLVIAVDRYLVICFPLKKMIKRSNAYRVIAAIWIISCVLFIPWTQFFRLHRFRRKTICVEQWPNSALEKTFFLGVVTLLVYALPLVIMGLCYTAITVRMVNRMSRMQEFDSRNCTERDVQMQKTYAQDDSSLELSRSKMLIEETLRHSTVNFSPKPNNLISSERQVCLRTYGGVDKLKTMKIVKMLVNIVVIFGLSWLPLFTIFNILKFRSTDGDFRTESQGADGLNLTLSDGLLMRNFTSNNLLQSEGSLSATSVVMHYIIPFTQLLGATNSCVNPWIYCLYSKTYRRAFRNVFCCTLSRTNSHCVRVKAIRQQRCIDYRKQTKPSYYSS